MAIGRVGIVREAIAQVETGQVGIGQVETGQAETGQAEIGEATDVRTAAKGDARVRAKAGDREAEGRLKAHRILSSKS